MNIGDRLKFVREKAGFTQAEVSAGTGIHPRTYQAYEQNRARPSIETLLMLTLWFGYLSIDGLLGLPTEKDRQNKVVKAYLSASPEKRKIIDYILSLNN